jgi:hypothetical protein
MLIPGVKLFSSRRTVQSDANGTCRRQLYYVVAFRIFNTRRTVWSKNKCKIASAKAPLLFIPQ